MNKKKIVLFDIDYTLFDTDKFRDTTYPQLMQFLQQEDSLKVKQIEKQLIEVGGYEPVIFARTLEKALQIKPQYNEISALFYNEKLYDTCLYEEAEPVFKTLSKMDDITLGIVSKGENSFQRRKIASLSKYLKNENIYISSNKFEKIDEIYNHYADKKIIIIDDSAPFLDAVKKSHEIISTIFIERKSRYEKREVPVDFRPDMRIATLTEMMSII